MTSRLFFFIALVNNDLRQPLACLSVCVSGTAIFIPLTFNSHQCSVGYLLYGYTLPFITQCNYALFVIGVGAWYDVH